MREMYKSGAVNMAKQIVAAVERANGGRILVFPHKSVDGDCMGSTTTVASILRKLGADAFVAIPEKLPETMSFMGVEDLLLDINEEATGVIAIAVDCSVGGRMGMRGDAFEAISDKLIIDHHDSVTLTGENVYIVPEASSASELVFYVAEEIASLKGVDLSEIIDERSAIGILTGMVTDTGRFTYKNTRPETLIVSGRLMELGGDISAACHNLFDRKKREEFMVSNMACVNSKFYYDGKFALCIVPDQMFKDTNSDRESVSDVVSRLRDVEGVELAIVLRDLEDGSVRANLRSMDYFDCSKFAQKYDGGGHIHAAGATFYNRDIYEIAEELIEEVGKLI